MTFVLLYGPPAVGKLTVAKELAELPGFKLFHNHLSIDLVESVFKRGTPSFGRVGKAVRQLVFEEAAEANINMIFTVVYAHPQDNPEMAWMLEIFERHGATIQLVQLTCDRAKLMERVGGVYVKCWGCRFQAARGSVLIPSTKFTSWTTSLSSSAPLRRNHLL